MMKTAGSFAHRLKRAAPLGRDTALVFAAAVGVRIAFALLTSDTYDYDEFVLLLLTRDFAHGAVPYSEFAFFHPPGALLFFRLFEPLTSIWWPALRVMTLAIDSATATLVLLVAGRLYDRRTSIIAGLLYAASPLAVVSAVRVGQDPLVTFLVTAGVAALVLSPSPKASLSAGVCIALAIYVKYPAAAFVPVYMVLAGKRWWVVIAGTATALTAAFVPFASEHHALVYDTVTFQRTRWLMGWDQRAITVGLYWIGINVAAVPALFRRRTPPWLALAFLTGAVFCLGTQVYYHYFVPLVPFASLLAAPIAAPLLRRSRLRTGAAVGSLAVLACWALLLDAGGASPLFVTAAHLSDLRPTVTILERATTPDEPVLADRFEYSYLARRPAALHYFWNVGVLISAQALERRSQNVPAVVLSFGASSGYPPGFTRYLSRSYTALHTPSTVVWLRNSTTNASSALQRTALKGKERTGRGERI